MEEEKILTLVIDAGELMMTSGAETYRVEETMRRMLEVKFPGRQGVFVTTTGIIASINQEDGASFAMVRSIKSRTIDLEKVSRINSLSRRYVGGEISAAVVREELCEISAARSYPALVSALMICLACAFFTIPFQGGWDDALCALCVGFVLGPFLTFVREKVSSLFMVNFMGGCLVGLLATVLFTLGLGSDLDVVIISCLMPMVPGVAFTNAVRDVLEGDYLSGVSRGMEALLVAISMAIGMGFGLTAITNILGGFPL